MTTEPKRAWLFAMSLESLAVSEKEGLLGADARTKKYVPQMAKGDIAVIYVGKRSVRDGAAGGRIQSFRALFIITAPSFQSDTPLWPVPGAFPFRIPVRLAQRVDVPLATVKEELSFTKNVANYGLFLLNAPQEIPMGDVDAILRAEAVKKGSGRP